MPMEMVLLECIVREIHLQILKTCKWGVSTENLFRFASCVLRVHTHCELGAWKSERSEVEQQLPCSETHNGRHLNISSKLRTCAYWLFGVCVCVRACTWACTCMWACARVLLAPEASGESSSPWSWGCRWLWAAEKETPVLLRTVLP